VALLLALPLTHDSILPACATLLAQSTVEWGAHSTSLGKRRQSFSLRMATTSAEALTYSADDPVERLTVLRALASEGLQLPGTCSLRRVHILGTLCLPSGVEESPSDVDAISALLNECKSAHKAHFGAASELTWSLHGPHASESSADDFPRGSLDDRSPFFEKWLDESLAFASTRPPAVRECLTAGEEPVSFLVLACFARWGVRTTVGESNMLNVASCVESSARWDGKALAPEGLQSEGACAFPAWDVLEPRPKWIPGPDTDHAVGFARGFLTEDAWRVPEACGSATVVYHELLGHALGVVHHTTGHPRGVMDMGQYCGLNLEHVHFEYELLSHMLCCRGVPPLPPLGVLALAGGPRICIQAGREGPVTPLADGVRLLVRKSLGRWFQCSPEDAMSVTTPQLPGMAPGCVSSMAGCAGCTSAAVADASQAVARAVGEQLLGWKGRPLQLRHREALAGGGDYPGYLVRSSHAAALFHVPWEATAEGDTLLVTVPVFRWNLFHEFMLRPSLSFHARLVELVRGPRFRGLYAPTVGGTVLMFEPGGGSTRNYWIPTSTAAMASATSSPAATTASSSMLVLPSAAWLKAPSSEAPGIRFEAALVSPVRLDGADWMPPEMVQYVGITLDQYVAVQGTLAPVLRDLHGGILPRYPELRWTVEPFTN
jgi:hypothetical protein